MSARRYRPMALLLLVLHLGACTSWQLTTVSPRQVVEAEQPSSVRITQPDGTQVVLKDPAIRNDSIVGTDEAGMVKQAALDDGVLEVRRLSVGKTIGLSIGLAALTAGILALKFLLDLEN